MYTNNTSTRGQGIRNRGQLIGNILIPIGYTNQQYSTYMAYLSIQMNMNRYFICICNPRLHSCLSKNIFDINSYKSKVKKRSTTKKLRNGLESLRVAKINKKLETLKTKPGFLSTGRGVLGEQQFIAMGLSVDLPFDDCYRYC